MHHEYSIFRDYVIDKKGVIEDLPFDDSVLAFGIGTKIFALTNNRSY